MIEALVAVHFMVNHEAPAPEWIQFWLTEARSPELLVELTAQFPADAARLQSARSLLALAIGGEIPALREALDAEVRAEREKDRIYWEPLKREMEAFRRNERGTAGGVSGATPQ